MEVMQTVWFQVIAILATITGLGIALDRIFITESIRERLEDYLTAPRLTQTWFGAYKSILSLAEAIVFDKYFSGPVGGWRFVRSTLIVSVLSFSIAIAVQYFFFFDHLPNISFSMLQLATVASFFMFNVLMDVITIGQTRAFIGASVLSERSFNSIAFFISDIIVTLNLFILTYAAFLLVLVQFFTIPEKSVEIRVTADQWRVLNDEIYVPDDLSQSLIETQIFYSLSLGADAATDSLEVLSTDPLTPQEAMILLQLLYDGDLNIVEIAPYVTSDLEGILGSSLSASILRNSDALVALSDPLTFDDFDVEGEGVIPRLAFELQLGLSGVRPSLNTLEALYTSAFLTVDALEDNFPYAMFNSSGWVSMKQFIQIYSAARLSGTPTATVLCENEAIYSLRFEDDGDMDRISRETLDENCEQSYIVRSRDFISNGQTLTSFGRGDDIYLPFSAMFITSMLPTFLLYFVMVGVTASSAIYRLLISRAIRSGDFIVQQPLGFFCFLLAILIVVVSLF